MQREASGLMHVFLVPDAISLARCRCWRPALTRGVYRGRARIRQARNSRPDHGCFPAGAAMPAGQRPRNKRCRALPHRGGSSRLPSSLRPMSLPLRPGLRCTPRITCALRRNPSGSLSVLERAV